MALGLQMAQVWFELSSFLKLELLNIGILASDTFRYMSEHAFEICFQPLAVIWVCAPLFVAQPPLLVLIMIPTMWAGFPTQPRSSLLLTAQRRQPSRTIWRRSMAIIPLL
jgi:hypothetical protein